MIDPETYLSNVTILIPPTSAVLGGMIVSFSVRDSQTQLEVRQKQSAIRFFLVGAAVSICLYLYEFYIPAFAAIAAFAFGLFLFFNVIIYRAAFIFTSIDENEQFGRAHYIAPLILTCLFLVFQLITPYDTIVRLVGGRTLAHTPINILYLCLFKAAHYLMLLFVMVYSAFGLRRLYSYYDKVRTKGSLAVRPGRWILMIGLLCTVSCFSLVNILLIPREELGRSVLAKVGCAAIVLMHIDISYHIITRRYRLYTLVHIPQRRRKRYQGSLNRRMLESYFRQKKPYLNPNFRIHDLVEAIEVNRNAISKFVNHTYGINFSRFVNRWRLKELQRVRREKAGQGLRNEELVIMAGFADVKHYLRVKAQESPPKGATSKRRNKLETTATTTPTTTPTTTIN
jgi:hypothetical protein